MKSLILASIFAISGLASAEIKPNGYVYQSECSKTIDYTDDNDQRNRRLDEICTATVNGDETKSEYLTSSESWHNEDGKMVGFFVWRINNSKATRATGRTVTVNMEVQWAGWIGGQNLYIPLQNEEIKILYNVTAFYRVNQAGKLELMSLSAEDFNGMDFKATQFETVMHSLSNTKTL